METKKQKTEVVEVKITLPNVFIIKQPPKKTK
jgi:hypothetical protein